MTKSLAELQQEAKPLLEKYDVNKLYATSDGQFFLLDSRAHLHAGKNLTVYTIHADDSTISANAEGNGSKEPLSVKALTEQIAQDNDLVSLNNILLEEVAGPNRASAVKAIEKRIAVLTTPQKPEVTNE